MGSTSMLWGLATPFLLAGAITASSMRLDIPDEERSSLLGSLLLSSPWIPSPWSPPGLHPRSQKFPYSSWTNPIQQQQQGLRRQQSSADLQTDLLRQYFALQGLHHGGMRDQHLQHLYRRVQPSRTNEQHRQEDGLQNNQGEDEGDAEGRKEDGEEGDGGASEEEFNQHLSVFPELLLDSQVRPRRLLRQKKEEEQTNFIKKTLLPYPRLG